MNGYLNIQCFEFSTGSVEKAYSFLGGIGKKGFEAVALFAGIVHEDKALIKEAICPAQSTARTEHGLLYSVDGDELHQINVWLYKNKLQLIAQIHSHPTEAYHSETDDEFPIIATLGGLSIVVPNFAQEVINHREWAYFQLVPKKKWKQLTKKDIKRLIKII